MWWEHRRYGYIDVETHYVCQSHGHLTRDCKVKTINGDQRAKFSYENENSANQMAHKTNQEF